MRGTIYKRACRLRLGIATAVGMVKSDPDLVWRDGLNRNISSVLGQWSFVPEAEFQHSSCRWLGQMKGLKLDPHSPVMETGGVESQFEWQRSAGKTPNACKTRLLNLGAPRWRVSRTPISTTPTPNSLQ